MPSKKRAVNKTIKKKKVIGARRPHSIVGKEKMVFVDIIRDVCYRYGIAMARFEFKGRITKPSIDEFRERIVHHIGLIENSLKEKTLKKAGKPFEQIGERLSAKLKLDCDKIRNGINLEVDNIYELA